MCVNVTDPRVAQCAAYDHRRHSDGRRYRWEPYPDLREPCALTCRAVGTARVRQLSPRVIDGTRCRDGSLDICIDGKCEVRWEVADGAVKNGLYWCGKGNLRSV